VIFFSYIKKVCSCVRVIGLDFALWKLFLQQNIANRGGRGREMRFVPESKTRVQIDDGAKLEIEGQLRTGYQLLKGAKQETRILLQQGATLCVKGKYVVRADSYIRVEPQSKLILHSGFMNENVQIICGDTIEIGEGTVIGNDTVIRSDDGHCILEEGYSQCAPIHIGNHVWIGQGVKILKGVNIGDGCVIASGAIVTKDIPHGCLAAGVPAKVIKENIKWAR